MDTNIENQDSATLTDAPQIPNVDNRTEDQMLGDILRNSEFTKDLQPEAEDVPAPEETLEDDDQVSPVDELESDIPSEEEVPVEDDTSTPSEAYELSDLDNFSINVKINGETIPVSIEELVKGYATDQSLSQKGRELGDARKQLETEREEKIAEIDNVLGAASDILLKSEGKLATEYHSFEDQIKEARENNDTYLVQELKDKKEVAQEKYWQARKEREALVETATKQKTEIEQHQFQERMQTFGKEIVNHIPDWSEEVATDIRDFVLSEGIPEAYLPQMADVNIIKFIDKYRRMERNRSVGAVKREKASPKAPPTRKQPPQAVKDQKAQAANRERVFSGEASADEQSAFLKNLAARHFDK